MHTFLTAAFLALIPLASPSADRAHVEGVIVGEPGSTSVLLLARSSPERIPPGRPGLVRFELSEDPAFPPEGLVRTRPIPATSESGYLARAEIAGLTPAATIHWRVFSGLGEAELEPGPTGSFRTLPGPSRSDPVRFCVVTGMNRSKFEAGYRGDDKDQGYPALATMRATAPDFVVFTGDNVYYDHPREPAARTRDELRAKWREQFASPRMRALFTSTATFWMKDDHDHRFNDCDTTGERPPASELGIATFREQVPVPERTWRTRRVSRDLQLWFVEGRDHRSPNRMEDGPGKTLWGAEQLAWLKSTLLESDARHLLLLSPTPLVGPDDAYKRDNHTNPRGFRHEGDAFLAWVAENQLTERFAVLCGDRHWQYHSVHPLGVEEFSCGALVDANARLGRRPGDPKSTDPEGLVRQPYVSSQASGGFLEVALSREGERPALALVFRDENGAELYRADR